MVRIIRANGGELVDLEFQTNHNYLDENIGASIVVVGAYFCDMKSKEVEGLSGSDVYRFSGKWVRAGGDIFDNLSPPPYRYHAGIYISHQSRHEGNGSGNNIFSYDLRAEPRDLCFYVRMGPYYHETSNTIRIPKEYLIQFFSENPKQ